MALPLQKLGLSLASALRLNLHLKSFGSLLLPSSAVETTSPFRTNYADWRMIRDVKRRKMTKEYSQERRLINCIRKNTVLPDEIKVLADQEIAALPRDSCFVRIRDRCAITSRGRGVVKHWRLSRIMWRQEADSNHLSGVQRSCW